MPIASNRPHQFQFSFSIQCSMHDSHSNAHAWFVEIVYINDPHFDLTNSLELVLSHHVELIHFFFLCNIHSNTNSKMKFYLFVVFGVLAMLASLSWDVDCSPSFSPYPIPSLNNSIWRHRSDMLHDMLTA